MPTYDYVCDACGHEFEKFHSMTAKPIKTCPKCAKNKVRRLISGGGGVLFKGSGFYQTDYRSSKYHESAKKDKPAETKSCPNAGKSSDCGSCKHAKK